MGKTITYYLIDDDADGRIKCTYSNWNGIVLKLPRQFIKDSDDRLELNHSGVYMLIGKNQIYIGQSIYKNDNTGVLKRLKQHLNSENKNFFDTAIVITTANNSLGATEISYLENTFYNTIKNAEIYKVVNENEPTLGNISEEKQSEMEDFFNIAKIMCETLGYFVFSKSKTMQISDDEMLYYKDAICKKDKFGFTVLKGSKVAKNYKEYTPKSVKIQIEKANINEDGTLLENITFSSASYSASFVTGRNENGLICWKNKSGVLLKELMH